jgi:hypothetical protein
MTRRAVRLLAACLALALPGAALAQTAADGSAVTDAAQTAELMILDAEGVDLDDFLWTKRVVVVFADTPADPRFKEQMEMLTSRPYDLIVRDVVVVTDTDPDARSEIRRTLRPRGFQVTLIGKDGQVELRKPSPWSSRELSRSIDKMPLRQQEVREQKAGAG